MRECRVSASCRAGCDRSVRYGVVLHRREVSLLRCKTVDKDAKFGRQCPVASLAFFACFFAKQNRQEPARCGA